MPKKKLSPAEERKQTELYIEFLKKRLDSENYKNNVSKEEYEKTKKAYDKAKFRLKIMKSS